MTRATRNPAAPRRLRRTIPVALTVAGVAAGSAAWACVPSDPQTRIQSCAAPTGAAVACKTPVGQPAFPNATSVKGPKGSSITAFVNNGLTRGGPYDLMFVSKPQLASGVACSAGTVISGTAPAIGTVNGGLPPTVGTIPATAALGGGQVCFANAPTHTLSNSLPAVFKVVI